ncbi:hypothetical protein T01_10786 [Trichinella spiralis]|uniref:Uncharacterized protein n=1 Tax=Trichinella spiralis TaxID=6334 RepID=A0A0V1ATD0_TRISP|nr:hypothetical protein T01_10786 [Trichinella spiralis]
MISIEKCMLSCGKIFSLCANENTERIIFLCGDGAGCGCGLFPCGGENFHCKLFAKLEIINKQQPDYRSQLKSVQSNKFSVDDVLKEKEGNEPEWAKK